MQNSELTSTHSLCGKNSNIRQSEGLEIFYDIYEKQHIYTLMRLFNNNGKPDRINKIMHIFLQNCVLMQLMEVCELKYQRRM